MKSYDKTRLSDRSEHPFLRRLHQGLPVLCDGAMGTLLHTQQLPENYCLDQCNLSHPDLILKIHQAYIRAGAEIIETNTYGANRFKLANFNIQDKVREINTIGAKLAVQTYNLINHRVFVAGAIGPLGKPVAPLGRISLSEARSAFEEQIEALLEGGVDLLMLETFEDVREIEQAILAARNVCDLPIVAHMSFGEDKQTRLGCTPATAVKALQAMGVDVLGANCTVGPRKMVQVISEMAQYATLPISAQPAAGRPEMVGDRIVYVSTPAYMAEQALDLVAQGARIVGGCCGTTPLHIRAIYGALQELQDQASGSEQSYLTSAKSAYREKIRISRQEDPEQSTDPFRVISQEASVHNTEGSFGWKIRNGHFVVSVELDPRPGINLTALSEAARMFAGKGVDAVNITDNSLGRVGISPTIIGAKIAQQGAVSPIVHFTTNDRSLVRLESDLLGAHEIGIRHVLVLKGDPTGEFREAGASVGSNVTPTGLMRFIAQMNEGYIATQRIGVKTDFLIGCAFNPTAPNIQEDIELLAKKLDAGADFVMTQPVYDQELAERVLEWTRPLGARVLLGVLPLRSYRNAEYLHNEVPGVRIPGAILDRMRAAGPKANDVGTEIAADMLRFAQKHFAGVYLIPQLGKYDMCSAVLDRLT